MSVTLQGWEIFAATGTGVAGATVQAIPASLFHPNLTAPSYTGNTDANGFWQTTALADGVYDVLVTYLGKVKWYKGLSVFSAGLLPQMFAAQAANKALVSPASGGSAVPTFRSLVTADLPAITQAIFQSGSLVSTTTSSGTNAQIATTITNITTTGGTLIAIGHLNCSNATVGNRLAMSTVIDGASFSQECRVTNPGANYENYLIAIMKSAPSAGSHNASIYFRSPDGGVTTGLSYEMLVLELKN